jgi:hypothetical protein
LGSSESSHCCRDVYLTRLLPEHAAVQFISRDLPPAAKIYLLFIGRRAYYCERDYLHGSGDLLGVLLAAIRTAKHPEQIELSPRQEQITHLVMLEDLLAAILNYNLTPDQAKVWTDFALNRGKLAFSDRGYSFHQLDG